MIQKKKFSDAIAANISVVGGLIGTANNNKNGLMSKDDYNKVARNVLFSGQRPKTL